VDSPDKNGAVNWDDFLYKGPSLEKIENTPAPQAVFESLIPPLSDGRIIADMKKDYSDWIYRTVKLVMRENKLLKVVARPGMTQAEFKTECTNAARTGRDLELAKSVESLDRQIDTIQRRLEKEKAELKNDQEELNSRSWEQTQTIAENVLGVFRRGRGGRLNRAIAKNRLKGQAEADVEESQISIKQMTDQIADLQKQKDQKTQEITDRWGSMVEKVEEVPLTPRKSDVYIDRFGIAWMPFYLVATDKGQIELPAFGGE
jgi:hypothetical protein